MLYGCGDLCGMGDTGLMPSFRWSTLGQDGTTDISTLDTSSLGLPGGILDPSSPTITVGQLSDYVNSGSADPSLIDQISSLVKAAGPAITGVLQQYQFGQLAANTPINQLPLLRSAVTGQAPSVLSGVFSSMSPEILIGGAVILFLLLRKGK